MRCTHCIAVHLQLNTGLSPQCEQYFRQQGYDFKLSNGRVVLVRRTRRRARQRRQGQVRGLKLLLFVLLSRRPPTKLLSVLQAEHHPSGAGQRPADHPPPEDSRSANHLDRPGICQGAGGGRAEVHRGQPPLIHGLPAGDSLRAGGERDSGPGCVPSCYKG